MNVVIVTQYIQDIENFKDNQNNDEKIISDYYHNPKTYFESVDDIPGEGL